jgi:sialate O-acetylesterase
MFSDWSHGQNGSYWFRTTVTLPKGCAGQKAVLRFGAMKDADTIYVNGQYVGNTTYEYPPRVYNVKEGILREGENEVMVHLMSQSGRPNFTRGKLYQLEVGDQTFPLPQQLQMAVGSAMNRKPSSTYFVDTPTGLYNAMIAPLQDFPVKGMLWYQGESNLGNTSNYADLLTAMVASWREQFKKEFPVVIMQLPGYMSKHSQPVETGWTQIRQQQMLAAERIPNAAIAPTLDTGEANDIHPQDKKTAGHRAALQMSRLAYGETSAAYTVPLPDSARVDVDAKCVYITIKGSDILHKDGKLKGFSVRVGDKYEWAEASLQDGKTVKVALPAGVTATTVRYCWDDYPEPTLFNIYGVPVPQFQIEAE